MRRLILAALAATPFFMAMEADPAAAAADQCATQYSSCQFPCAATNTDAGLACVNKCIAQRDACYASQPKTTTPSTTTKPAQGTTGQKDGKTQKEKKKKKEREQKEEKKKRDNKSKND